MNLLQFFAAHRAEILRSMLEHMSMVSIAVLLATLIGVPLGVLVTRISKLRVPVLGFSNVVQTIPSLALFGFLLPLPWLAARSERVAITALALYSLLPIIRNTYAGITGVDPAVREVGRGMGMTDRQLLFQVELPLAMGTIMAGIRVAALIGICVAHIAAAVGAGRFGGICFRRSALGPNQPILS